MGATNHGTQQIAYDYYENMTSLIVNSRHVGSKLRGIYSGGYLTRVSDSEITISPMVVEIGDGAIQARVQTTVAATLNSTTLDSGAISSSTPYIVLRRAYLASVVNYMEIHAIASVAVAQANDIIVGKCVFSGSVLTSFNYTDRTFMNIQDLFLKVESTGVTEMYVQVRAGRIQNTSGVAFVPETKVGPFTAPGSPNSRIDLVYIDTDGTISISQGTAAINPSAPDYGGKTVVAQIRLVNGDISIPSNRITDTRSFISLQNLSGLGAWADKDSLNNILVNNSIYQASSDGEIYAFGTGSSNNSHMYGWTPYTVKRTQNSVEGDDPIGITFRVRKNDSWRVTVENVIGLTIYWLPTGNGQCIKQ